jgi:hypothetical protein
MKDKLRLKFSIEIEQPVTEETRHILKGFIDHLLFCEEKKRSGLFIIDDEECAFEVPDAYLQSYRTPQSVPRVTHEDDD